MHLPLLLRHALDRHTVSTIVELDDPTDYAGDDAYRQMKYGLDIKVCQLGRRYISKVIDSVGDDGFTYFLGPTRK